MSVGLPAHSNGSFVTIMHVEKALCVLSTLIFDISLCALYMGAIELVTGLDSSVKMELVSHVFDIDRITKPLG